VNILRVKKGNVNPQYIKGESGFSYGTFNKKEPTDLDRLF
jgi:hypothetical protein